MAVTFVRNIFVVIGCSFPEVNKWNGQDLAQIRYSVPFSAKNRSYSLFYGVRERTDPREGTRLKHRGVAYGVGDFW